jgi:hypothetical protein
VFSRLQLAGKEMRYFGAEEIEPGTMVVSNEFKIHG